jgi:hypothetical protein
MKQDISYAFILLFFCMKNWGTSSSSNLASNILPLQSAAWTHLLIQGFFFISLLLY